MAKFNKLISKLTDDQLMELFNDAFPNAATDYPNISIDKKSNGEIWIKNGNKYIKKIEYKPNATDIDCDLFSSIHDGTLAAINNGNYDNEKFDSLIEQLNKSYSNCTFTYEYSADGQAYVILNDGTEPVSMPINSNTSVDEIIAATDEYLKTIPNGSVRKKRKDTGLDEEYTNELGVENANYYKTLFSKNVKRDFIVDINTDELSNHLEDLSTIKTIYGESKIFTGGDSLTDDLKTYYDGLGGDEAVNKEAIAIAQESNLLYSKIFQLIYLYQETDVKLDLESLKYYLDNRDINDVTMFFNYYAQGFDGDLKDYEAYKELMTYWDEYSNELNVDLTKCEFLAAEELLDNCVRGAYFSYVEKLSSGDEHEKDIAARLEKMWPQFSYAFGKSLCEKIDSDPSVLCTTDSTRRYQNNIHLLSAEEIQACVFEDGSTDYYQLALATLAAQDYPLSYIFQPSKNINYTTQKGNDIEVRNSSYDDTFVLSDLFIESMYKGFKAIDTDACNDFKYKVMELCNSKKLHDDEYLARYNRDPNNLPYYNPKEDPNAVYVDDDFYFLSAKEYTKLNHDYDGLENTLFNNNYFGESTSVFSRGKDYDYSGNSLKNIYNHYTAHYNVGLIGDTTSYEDIHALLMTSKNAGAVDPALMKKAFDAISYINKEVSDEPEDGNYSLAFKNYINDYSEYLQPFYDKFINENSDTYMKQPEILEKLGYDTTYENLQSHWDSAFKDEEEAPHPTSVWDYLALVWNTPVSVLAGAGQFVDSVVNTGITAVGYSTILLDLPRYLFAGDRHSREAISNSMLNKYTVTAKLVAAPKLYETISKLYADTNCEVANGILTTIGEGVGYYAAAIYTGTYIANAAGLKSGTYAYNLIKHIPGAIAAAGKQSNKVAKKALKDLDGNGKVKAKYMYLMALESAFAGLSYYGSYVGADCWGTYVKAKEIGGKFLTNLGKATIKAVATPTINEAAYSLIEGREFDVKSWRNEVIKGAAAQAAGIMVSSIGDFAKWVKEIKGVDLDIANVEGSVATAAIDSTGMPFESLADGAQNLDYTALAEQAESKFLDIVISATDNKAFARIPVELAKVLTKMATTYSDNLEKQAAVPATP